MERRLSQLKSNNMVRSWLQNVVNPLSTTITIQQAAHSCGIKKSHRALQSLITWDIIMESLYRGNGSSIPVNATDLNAVHRCVWVFICVYST